MEAFSDQLNFPTSLCFGPEGELYVAESGLPFGGAPAGGTVSRVNEDGSRQVLVSALRGPVNGVLWLEGGLIISEGGHPGRIIAHDLCSGQCTTLVDGLPGFGNYHTNMVVLGPDGKLYFSQGAMTNSAIMGADSVDLAWLRELQHNADIPGYDITLANVAASAPGPDGQPVPTGAFAPFGTVHPGGTHLPGRTPCTASVMRCNPDGSGLELVAWGLRNAYGLGFLPDGRLLATDQGADVRGVRPVWNCPDFLYDVKPGAWYGWPDYFGGLPINHARYRAPDGRAQPFVLADHAALPPPEGALAEFALNACAVKFTIIPEPLPHAGDLLVALFGDERPMTGPSGPQVGRHLARVSTRDWGVHPVTVLAAQAGAAARAASAVSAAEGHRAAPSASSANAHPRLRRPLDLAFSPDGQWLYVVDFGEFEFTEKKSINARAHSGCVWRIRADQLEHSTMSSTVSFENDIAPLFRQFRASMTWRLDLTKYEDVKLNAPMVYSQISQQGMPPPPYPPLTTAQIAMFKAWMDQGYAP